MQTQTHQTPPHSMLANVSIIGGHRSPREMLMLSQTRLWWQKPLLDTRVSCKSSLGPPSGPQRSQHMYKTVSQLNALAKGFHSLALGQNTHEE